MTSDLSVSDISARKFSTITYNASLLLSVYLFGVFVCLFVCLFTLRYLDIVLSASFWKCLMAGEEKSASLMSAHSIPSTT